MAAGHRGNLLDLAAQNRVRTQSRHHFTAAVGAVSRRTLARASDSSQTLSPAGHRLGVMSDVRGSRISGWVPENVPTAIRTPPPPAMERIRVGESVRGELGFLW